MLGEKKGSVEQDRLVLHNILELLLVKHIRNQKEQTHYSHSTYQTKRTNADEQRRRLQSDS